MFCHQCGAKLENGMRFCPSCGAKIFVEGLSTDQNIAELDKPSKNLDFTLLGEKVHFDETLPLYLALRLDFEQMASEKAEDFFENFYKSYCDMDHFIHNFPSDFSFMMSKVLGKMQSHLSEIDIFGVTQDIIQPYMQKYCYHTYAVIQDVQEEYQEIVNKQEEMRSYRQAQKDHRGRVVGGGFGFKGAVKGMATAGAINMTTGALYSIGNAIGNMGSSISTSKAKDKLFRGSLRYRLRTAIDQDILGVHLVTVDVITAQTGHRMCRFTEEDAKQANKILSDLNTSRIPSHNRRMAVIRMLTIYPFSRIYYQLAVQMFPSHLEEIRSFADFFHIDIDEIYREFRENVDLAVDILLEYKDEIDNEILDIIDDDIDDDNNLPPPLTTNLADMLVYFEYIFKSANETGFTFFTKDDNTKRARLSNASQAYANYRDEIPLILYDSTLGRSSKEGFLVTDKHIYISVYKDVHVLSLSDALQDIHQVEQNQCIYLCFEQDKVFLLNKGDLVKKETLPDFIEFMISFILFLSECKPTENNLWKAISQYQALPQPRIEASSTPALNGEDEGEKGVQNAEPNLLEPKVCYCFECGAENEAGAKYCFECGAELF